jgi:hypothetical protein
MADLHMLLDRMRRDLLALEAGISAAPPPMAFAWLSIDSGGVIRECSPAALERLGLEGRQVVDRQIGSVVDLDGDPLHLPRFDVLTPAGRIAALSLPRSGGAVIVLGGEGEPLARSDAGVPRRLVHDLANVLGVIRGRAEMVGLEQTTDLARRCIGEIVAAVDRAQEMLEASREGS